MMPPCNFM